METEKIKLSELLAMDMGQLSDWMVSKKGSYDTVTLSPQTEQAEASSLSDLLCGKMWGYWCCDRKKFYHIYESRLQVEMCSPDGFKTNEKEGYGKIMEVEVTAV